MSRNTSVLIAVAIVLILGWLALGRKSSDTTSTPTATNQTSASPTVNDSTIQSNATTVTYTDSGYSPATITISPGTTVIFVNESSNAMWTASDPHPTHTNYSGFDADRGYDKGESYSFTFSKEGSWGYHNHLKSADKGTITVQ